MQSYPTFSVVVPAYKRPRRLAQCLRALNDQQFPQDQFEVIVIDDGSPRSLAPVVDAFQSKLTVAYYRQPNRGPAAARNAGAARAKGRYLAFTDDDCAPSPTWLSLLAQGFDVYKNAMIGGLTINALAHNLFSSASQLLIDFLYEYYNLSGTNGRFFTSNNFALPTNLFWRVGGFDESMPLSAGEDREFCDRWLQHELRLVYLPAAKIYHFHRLGLFSFWQQHFNYGRGAWQYRQIRSRRCHEPVQLEPSSFYCRLITFPLTLARDIRAYILTGMLSLTQAANAAGFFYERYWGKKGRIKKGSHTESLGVTGD